MIKKSHHTRITGIGSALMDLLIHEKDLFLQELGKEKGGMTLVEDADIRGILKQSAQLPVVVSGGAACNTIVGVGRLGGKARFIGKRGDDGYGDLFENQLKLSNVEPLLEGSKSPTGKVLSIITPDAQRSMFTFLGASVEMDPAAITKELFEDTAVAVIEGYLLFNPALIVAALRAAKASDTLIALDLASFEVVESSKDILESLIKDYVDILIANEDEARAYTGFSDEAKAIERLAEDVSAAVLKVGQRGSYISAQGEVIRIKPKTGGEAKDTTGAGDLWASGFLYGIAHGFSMERSGQLASACGYEVCQVVGAHIPEDRWDVIRQLL